MKRFIASRHKWQVHKYVQFSPRHLAKHFHPMSCNLLNYKINHNNSKIMGCSESIQTDAKCSFIMVVNIIWGLRIAQMKRKDQIQNVISLVPSLRWCQYKNNNSNTEIRQDTSCLTLILVALSQRLGKLIINVLHVFASLSDEPHSQTCSSVLSVSQKVTARMVITISSLRSHQSC